MANKGKYVTCKYHRTVNNSVVTYTTALPSGDYRWQVQGMLLGAKTWKKRSRRFIFSLQKPSRCKRVLDFIIVQYRFSLILEVETNGIPKLIGPHGQLKRGFAKSLPITFKWTAVKLAKRYFLKIECQLWKKLTT